MKISDLKSLFLEIEKKKTVCFVTKLLLLAAWLKVPENRTYSYILEKWRQNQPTNQTNKQTNKQPTKQTTNQTNNQPTKQINKVTTKKAEGTWDY